MKLYNWPGILIGQNNVAVSIMTADLTCFGFVPTVGRPTADAEIKGPSVVSAPSPLVYNVPRCLVHAALSHINSAHGCDFHNYVDDTEHSQSAPLVNSVLCRQAFRHVSLMSFLG